MMRHPFKPCRCSLVSYLNLQLSRLRTTAATAFQPRRSSSCSRRCAPWPSCTSASTRAHPSSRSTRQSSGACGLQHLHLQHHRGKPLRRLEEAAKPWSAALCAADVQLGGLAHTSLSDNRSRRTVDITLTTQVRVPKALLNYLTRLGAQGFQS